MDVNAECNVDEAGVYCDVNISPEYEDNVDADNNSKVNADNDDLPNVGEKKSNDEIDVEGDVTWIFKLTLTMSTVVLT